MGGHAIMFTALVATARVATAFVATAFMETALDTARFVVLDRELICETPDRDKGGGKRPRRASP